MLVIDKKKDQVDRNFCTSPLNSCLTWSQAEWFRTQLKVKNGEGIRGTGTFIQAPKVPIYNIFH